MRATPRASVAGRGSWPSAILIPGLLIAALLWPVSVSQAWEDLIILEGRQQAQFGGRIVVQPVQPDATVSNGSISEDYPHGAPLPTDPEVDRILRRADEYVAEGRFDLAIVVWQKVLDENKSEMRTADNRTYHAVQSYIEGQLYSLAVKHPVGLREYRLKADAEARALLASATGEDEERKLADVVRRYFFSSLGDDAAYTLGCLMLDRFEFVAAARLFGKILSTHPDYAQNVDAFNDTNIPYDDVLLRYTVALAKTGDAKTAGAALKMLTELPNVSVNRDVLAAVQAEIDAGGNDVIEPGALAGAWHTAHGTPARDGHMPALDERIQHRTDWHDRWFSMFNSSGEFGVPNAGGQNQSAEARRAELRSQWQSGHLLPSHRLLLSEGRVYYRGYDKVVCMDGRTGKLLWWKQDLPPPQVRPYNNAVAEAIPLFADRGWCDMSIHNGVIYFLSEDPSQTVSSRTQAANFRTITGYPSQYANKLMAVDARNGKFLWEKAGEQDANGATPMVNHAAAPTAYGNVLLCPVYENESLWLYARDANDGGKLLWKTFLCDAPNTTGVDPWTPVTVSVAGGDAYVLGGNGVVFNVDATGGQVRWAVRYKRAMENNFAPQSRGRYNYASPDSGFDDNFIAPFGRHLIVVPSDGDVLFSLDRSTGRKLWDSQRNDATHCLGVMGRSLYVAGQDFVRMYDIPTGKLAATSKDPATDASPFNGTITGRGFVAPDAVYLPVGTSIARLDPKKISRRLSQVQVNLPYKGPDDQATMDYVGNIFTDGTRVYGVGLERVYALMDHKRPPANVKAGAAPPLSSRDFDNAALDMLAANGIEPTFEALGEFLRGLHPSEETKARVKLLIDQLGDETFEVRQVAQQELMKMPLVPVEALTEATRGPDAERSQRASEILDQTAGRQTRMLYAVLKAIDQEQVKGLAAEVLAAVSMCNERFLVLAARDAMVATAEADDAAALRAAVGHDSVDTRVVAVSGLGAAAEYDAADDLADVFKTDAAERVRFAAARALANMGDRASLAMLAELLLAEDVYVRTDAIKALRNLTGQRLGYVPYDEQKGRNLAVANWRKWIADNGATASLNYPLTDSRFMLGRTIVCNYRQNRVYELDEKGEETWSIQVQNPWGAQGLPNGHRVVTSYTQRTVTEYDEKGKEVWKQSNLPSAPFSVERLDNGNTLIACSNSNRVVELNKEGKYVWDHTIVGRPTTAQRLPDGRTLIALQSANRVIEVDREGKVLWSIDGVSNPLSAVRLSNGNTLVCEVGANRVREFDSSKNEVWSSTKLDKPLKSPYHAERLDNGNTIISDYYGIRELKPTGDIVWEKQERYISRFHRY